MDETDTSAGHRHSSAEGEECGGITRSESIWGAGLCPVLCRCCHWGEGHHEPTDTLTACKSPVGCNLVE